MTAEFLAGMGALSKDMMKLTKESDFKKVQQQFEEAMMNVEAQTEQMEEFMHQTESSFSTQTSGSDDDNAEIEAFMTNEASAEDSTEQEIEKELEDLKKKMSE